MALEPTAEISVAIPVDVENVQASAAEISTSTDIVTASKDIIPFEKETVFESASECSLKFQAATAVVPAFAFEIEKASVVKEITLEKETISPISHNDCFKEIATNVETPAMKAASDYEIPCKEEMVSEPGFFINPRNYLFLSVFIERGQWLSLVGHSFFQFKSKAG